MAEITTIKEAIELLTPISEGEKVLAEYTEDLLRKYIEARNSMSECAEFQKLLMRKMKVAKAKTVMFWEDSKHLSEMAESSEARGNMLCIRKQGDKAVLTEVKAPENNIPPFLGALFGGGLPTND